MRHALLVALAGITVLAACSKTVPAPDPVRAVRTQTVAPQTAGGAYEYAGEVKARTESRLSFRVAGKMLKRAVDLGDSVKAGQMLAELDPRDLRLGQDAARASVAMAQASYDQNAADFKRYKDLHDQGFIGPAELERRDMALKTARAQLDQAKAQSNVQGNQAGYAALLADAAGVITGVDVEPGMVVAAGAPVLRLAHDGPRDVVFSVPEDKVGLVKALAAQPGRFKVRLWGSAPEEPLPATIREISAAADPVTRTFEARFVLNGAPATAPLGSTVTVRLGVPGQPAAITVPLAAIYDRGRGPGVWVISRQGTPTVSWRAVKVAAISDDAAVVSAGLRSGERFVALGAHMLHQGEAVRIDGASR